MSWKCLKLIFFSLTIITFTRISQFTKSLIHTFSFPNNFSTRSTSKTLTSFHWIFTFPSFSCAGSGLSYRTHKKTFLCVSFHKRNFVPSLTSLRKNNKCYNILFVSPSPYTYSLILIAVCRADVGYVNETNEKHSGPARKLLEQFFSLLFQFTFSFWLGKFCGEKLRLALKFRRLKGKKVNFWVLLKVEKFLRA